MNVFKQFALISAERKDLTQGENETRTNQLKLMLEHSKLFHVEGQGFYDGHKEVTFFVELPNQDDIERIEMIGLDRFQQDCVAIQYPDGHTRLHYPNEVEYLGKIRQVTEEYAKKQDAYSVFNGIHYARVS